MNNQFLARKNKKGVAAFNIMKMGALALGIAFIVASLVVTVISELDAGLTGSAQDVTGNATAGLVKLTSFGTTMGIVLAIVILLSLVTLIKLGKK